MEILSALTQKITQSSAGIQRLFLPLPLPRIRWFPAVSRPFLQVPVVSCGFLQVRATWGQDQVSCGISHTRTKAQDLMRLCYMCCRAWSVPFVWDQDVDAFGDWELAAATDVERLMPYVL